MHRKPDYYGPASTLTEDEVAAMWGVYVETKDIEIRDALIEYYMPLVYQGAERMAKKLPSFIDVNDLISAGTLGLLYAIDRFDPEQGTLFSTYCSNRIRGSILDELRRQDWAPRLVRSRVNQLERSKEELGVKLGRKPNDEEIAKHMGLTMDQFNDLLKETRIKSMVSLDRKWDENDDHEMGQIETLPDNRIPNPLTAIVRAEVKEMVVKGLSEKEKLVLVMYYFDNLSLKEIGAVLDLSESRVCQIRTQALDFLRVKLKVKEEHATSL